MINFTRDLLMTLAGVENALTERVNAMMNLGGWFSRFVKISGWVTIEQTRDIVALVDSAKKAIADAAAAVKAVEDYINEQAEKQ